MLHNVVKGKLDPQWTGPWEVMGLKGTMTVQLKTGDSECTVYTTTVWIPCWLSQLRDWIEPPHTSTHLLFHHEMQQAWATPRLSGVPGDPLSSNPTTQTHARLKHPRIPLLYRETTRSERTVHSCPVIWMDTNVYWTRGRCVVFPTFVFCWKLHLIYYVWDTLRLIVRGTCVCDSVKKLNLVFCQESSCCRCVLDYITHA